MVASQGSQLWRVQDVRVHHSFSFKIIHIPNCCTSIEGLHTVLVQG